MSIIALSFWLNGWISSAYATGIHTTDAPCPIDDEDTVKLYFQISSNEYGGFDSDGATYSSGMQFREHAISTCTKSLFSAYPTDMQASFSPDDIQQIKTWLTPIAEQYPNPMIWERYEIAAAYYRWKGKPALFMGRLYLEAAWTARDKAVGIHPDLKGPVVADQILEQGAKELQKELTLEQRKMVTFNLARVAHRNAQFDKREQYLKAFLADPELEKYEREAGLEFSKLTKEVEPRLLRLARSEYMIHLQQAPKDGQTMYLLGDLNRRLGEYSQARMYFEQANLTPQLQPEQRMIIAHFLETMPNI